MYNATPSSSTIRAKKADRMGFGNFYSQISRLILFDNMQNVSKVSDCCLVNDIV